MSKFKFELNRKGVNELLKSSEMQELLNSEATKIKNKCGDGYSQDSFVGKNRVNAMVFCESDESFRDNNQNNTLLKAIK